MTADAPYLNLVILDTHIVARRICGRRACQYASVAHTEARLCQGHSTTSPSCGGNTITRASDEPQNKGDKVLRQQCQRILKSVVWPKHYSQN
jgi:hypothetical protein